MIQKPCTNLSHKCNLLRRTLQVKQQASEAVVCRKHLGLSLLACSLLKRDYSIHCFPSKFTKFLRTPFFIEQLQWVLLRFNSCFQRSPGQKPMRLSPIHTRFHTRFHTRLIPKMQKQLP